MDHTDGHLYDAGLPRQLGDPGRQRRTNIQSFRARSNVTSYGTHSVFSGGEVTTSGATPFQAAFLGMVQSAAMNAVDAETLPAHSDPERGPSGADEHGQRGYPPARPSDRDRQWPGNPDSITDATHTNWSTQYGYGRVNIGKATKLIMDGRVPPTALIESPDWYRYVDPSRQKSVPDQGLGQAFCLGFRRPGLDPRVGARRGSEGRGLQDDLDRQGGQVRSARDARHEADPEELRRRATRPDPAPERPRAVHGDDPAPGPRR